MIVILLVSFGAASGLMLKKINYEHPLFGYLFITRFILKLIITKRSNFYATFNKIKGLFEIQSSVCSSFLNAQFTLGH